MKSIIVGTLSAVTLCLASCGSSPDMSKIQVNENNTVSWEDAKVIIERGKVDCVAQSHSLDVTITMVDGTSYRTKEPKIDAVYDWLKKCGKRDKVGYATE
jgi:hypothetical protein